MLAVYNSHHTIYPFFFAGLTVKVSGLIQSSAVKRTATEGAISRQFRGEASKGYRDTTTKAAPGEGPGRRTSKEGEDDHEPEAFILLVAGCIGLATGAGVVVLNYAIHEIQVAIHRLRR